MSGMPSKATVARLKIKALRELANDLGVLYPVKNCNDRTIRLHINRHVSRCKSMAPDEVTEPTSPRAKKKGRRKKLVTTVTQQFARPARCAANGNAHAVFDADQTLRRKLRQITTVAGRCEEDSENGDGVDCSSTGCTVALPAKTTDAAHTTIAAISTLDERWHGLDDAVEQLIARIASGSHIALWVGVNAAPCM